MENMNPPTQMLRVKKKRKQKTEKKRRGKNKKRREEKWAKGNKWDRENKDPNIEARQPNPKTPL